MDRSLEWKLETDQNQLGKWQWQWQWPWPGRSSKQTYQRREECWERERGDTGSGRLHETMPPSSPTKTEPPPSWSHLWLGNTHKAALNHVLLAMKTQLFHCSNPISLLSDELLLQILSRLPHSQRNSNFLVSKQWLNLQGRLVRSLKLLDWNFLVSGRLFLRFPNLIHIDLVHGSIISPRHSPILLTHKLVSFHVDSHLSPNGFAPENYAFMLSVDQIDSGLKALACRYPNLRKLVVVNASEMGLLSVAEECPTLQELELHRCTDQVLRGIAAIQNLRILKLVANVDGFYYGSLVSDIGLTILAEGCGRLVKLELSGCEGSYEGMKAIGEGCETLEELVLVSHRMDGGWLLALSFCRNLKTLRFQGCKRVDSGLGLDECLVSCPLLERLILERCQLRDKGSLRALFLVCETVREIVFQDCWGLENDAFGIACICRGVKFLSLEGCSLLTTQGLASVLFSWKELQSLEVVSCQNIKDNEVTPALSALFSQLKELKWRPNTKSLLSSTLAGTGMGKKGSKFFSKY